MMLWFNFDLNALDLEQESVDYIINCAQQTY